MIELDFAKLHGLVPAVLQDADTGAVLMVGFMNRAAYQVTLETGRATFLSRHSRRLWVKGERSGNYALVQAIYCDCDRDALLVKVRVAGEGVICHKGTTSCFAEEVPLASAPWIGGAHEPAPGNPNGSPETTTPELLARAGLEVHSSARTHLVKTSDPESDPNIECLRIRAQEMTRYVLPARLSEILPAGLAVGIDYSRGQALAPVKTLTACALP